MSAQALWMEAAEGRLFGVLHAARSPLRAGVVFCAPILHEYVRSHRLFALLAHELSGHGFNVLRFDYRGTGDSEGADETFSMQRAAADAEVAIEHLRASMRDRPVICLGIRAGAFPAAHLARNGRCEQLWLWQPVVDGSDYLRRLRERDQAERVSAMRYPRARIADAAEADTLMGFPCGNECLEQLQSASWSNAGIDAATVTLLDQVASADSPAHAGFLPLPEALAAWADELDMARVALAPVRAIASELAGGEIRT
jgi:pimeloyl-ACP methyl ester carboxylesterase